MIYATQQDLEERFGADELVQLTDVTNQPQTTIDATRVARALADASALVDGYVSRIADLPLTAVPELLARITCDVARYYLHAGGVDKDNVVARAYRDALEQLDGIGAGRIRLATAAGATPAAPAEPSIRFGGPDRIFDRDSLRGY